MIDLQAAKDVPGFSIIIDGNESRFMRDVLSISVRNEIARITEAEIVCLDYLLDDNGNIFPNANLADMAPGKEIELQAGYGSEKKSIFKGSVVKIAQKQNQSGSLQSVYTLKHKAYRLTLERKNRMFADSTDSNIFNTIIKDYSLNGDADNTDQQHEKMVQFNITDWDFINLRAEANSQLLIIDGEKITFKKPLLGANPVVTLKHGQSLLEFEVELDSRSAYADYSAKVWNKTDQSVSEITAPTTTFDSPGGNTNISDLANQTSKSKYNLFVHSDIPSTEAEELLKSRILKNNLSKMRGRARCDGTTDVKPGSIIKIEGIGQRFGGNAFVSGVLHSYNLSDGWKTDFQLGLNNNLFFNKFSDIIAPATSAATGPIEGLQTAVVTGLEGDPTGEFRIRIKLPLFDPENEIWARIALPDAGKERGVFFIPDISDEVIVGFINNDPRQAVILGALHSSSLLAPNVLKDDNFLKGFYTREKSKLEFNDEKGIITIITKKNQKIIIDDSEDKITIEDLNGNKINMTSSGILMESSKDISFKTSGDIKLEGLNINIKASAQLKAEGSAGAELSSSANAVLKGSMVQIN